MVLNPPDQFDRKVDVELLHPYATHIYYASIIASSIPTPT